ncbi:MAG: thiol:disulfide interchange protein [Verrucomicrobiaceae bacterium]|nr:thiol:disulfide interchange protein [Verrucomicrobiaceae bacterium]
MQRFKLFIPLIVFAVLAIFFFVVQKQIGSGDYDPQNMPSALLDKPAPTFSLPDVQSGKVVSSDLIKNKIVLINVWATWCPSCYFEHPYLLTLAQQGVVILGVDYKDEPDKAQAWLREKGDPYIAVLDDRAGTLGLDLGVTGAPETYLVDSTGVVRLRYQGPLDERVWKETFQPLLTQLQNAKSGS